MRHKTIYIWDKTEEEDKGEDEKEDYKEGDRYGETPGGAQLDIV